MIRRRGLIEVFGMTTNALCRETEPVELTDGSDLVAGVAVNHCVGANKREAILVFIDVMNGNLPAIGVMTELALGTVLSAVKVRVAVLALIRCICEVEVGVAVAARHGGVPPPQREAGLRVTEFDSCRQNFPILTGMTGLTWNVELPMRAACRCDGLWGLRGCNARREREHKGKRNEGYESVKEQNDSPALGIHMA